MPDGGPTLRDTSPTLQTWADLLTHVAVTQRELADQRSRLTMVPTLATRDSAAYLERLIDGLANRPMGDPQHIGLVEARELTAALDSLAGDADLLTELEIPDTLQINDVHTGNACGPARPDGPLRIFDLGDSVWSHPFAVLAVPMRMVSETNPTGPLPRGERSQTLARAYVSQWPEVAVRLWPEILRSSDRLAAVHRVASWERLLRGVDADHLGMPEPRLADWMRPALVPETCGPSR